MQIIGVDYMFYRIILIMSVFILVCTSIAGIVNAANSKKLSKQPLKKQITKKTAAVVANDPKIFSDIDRDIITISWKKNEKADSYRVYYDQIILHNAIGRNTDMKNPSVTLMGIYVSHLSGVSSDLVFNDLTKHIRVVAYFNGKPL